MHLIVEGSWNSCLTNVESVEHPPWEGHKNGQASRYLSLWIKILAQKKIQIDVEFNHRWPPSSEVFSLQCGSCIIVQSD